MSDASSSSATEVSATDVLPGYELSEQLGRGATTVVYRARRAGTTGPDVAVKMLREASADAPELAATYRREAALLARVTHPSVAAVHAAGEAAGRPYIVLELVEGASLAWLLDDGPLPEAQVLQIAIDTAGALSAVRRMLVVHRDVKPGNLLLTPSGRTKLIDFDLASWTGEPAPDESVAGTPAYSAPEQTGMFARPVDGRADLYALGVVLFECVTGRPPFDAPDVGELLHLHAVEAPPDVRDLRPDCSPGLAAVIAKLLAKDPDDRYQTAVGLLSDLSHLRDGTRQWPFPLDTANITFADIDRPLVGRDAELTRLVERWERTANGEGGLVVLDGAPGTGAGRLARALMETVTQRGSCVLAGRCSDDAPPLAVLRTAVRRHVEAVQRLPRPQRDAAEQVVRHAADGVESLLMELSPELSTVLDAEAQPPAGDDLQERIAAAAAGFIGELAIAQGGLLLMVLDVHRIDTASQRALQYLCAESETAPLMILVTTPDDAAAKVESGLLMPPDTRLHLGPLTPPAVAELVSNDLGGAHVPPEIIDQLTARTGGNPFAVLEYVRELIDCGGLQPSWGTWTLDASLLDRLHLPSDVTDLLVARLEGLSMATRHLLAAAAVQGMRFDATLLATTVSGAGASGSEPAGGDQTVTADQIAEAIAVATRQRVIEHVADDVYTFVHHQVRDTVLADLGATERAGLHQRIAAALEAQPAADTEHIYAVARHRVAAGTEPDRTFTACVAAANAALAGLAPADAAGFLDDATHAAAAAAIPLNAEFRRTYATALLRAGDPTAALEQLNDALVMEPDAMRRAELIDLIATVQLGTGDGDQAILSVRRGLTELGMVLPRRLPLLMAASVARFFAGLLVRLSPWWFGTATGDRRRHYEVEATLLDTGAQAAAVAMNIPLSTTFLLLGLLPVNRIGSGPQRARVLSALCVMAHSAKASRIGRRVSAAGLQEATKTNDRALIATSQWLCSLGETIAQSRIDPIAAVTEHHGRWLEVPDYMMAVSTLVIELVSRGQIAAAETWVERARKRLRLGVSAEAALSVECMATAVKALRGRAAAASTSLRTALEAMPDPAQAEHQPLVAWAQLTILVEQAEFGDAFDEAVARLDGAQTQGAHLSTFASRYMVAYGRVAQARAAAARPDVPAQQRDLRVRQARAAIRALRAARRIPRLRAGRLALRAGMLQQAGRDRAALHTVHRALGASDEDDAPLQSFDVLVEHARILRSLDRVAAARRHATFALLLATEHGWAHRARAVRSEFAIHGPSGSTPATSGSSARRSVSGAGDVHQRRRLEALQQVTTTAASVLDPEEVISVALDTTMRLLSAERVFIFLAQRDGRRGDTLAPHRGRDINGEELHELTNYSSTVVEQVWDTREPLIVTGSEHGAALGSQSAVVHGLRSILVAPLQLKGRNLGVIYLDSRVARGIFTTEDVDLLVAITHQIAASLETARAARLDSEIQATKRERDLAETLRTSMEKLNATLDPDEVLHRLLHTVATILPGDRAVLLRQDADQLVVTAHQGTTTDEMGVFDVASHPTLDALASRDAPLVGGTDAEGERQRAGGRGSAMALPPELSDLLNTPRSWIAVPITLRGQRSGAIVVGSAEPDRYGDVEINVAAVLGDQGATAYANAQLFSRAHQAATVDVLTGAATRHYFWELAQHQLAAAIRAKRPLTALMVDIDHFKPVNDTYGHAVGDIVLREVAARIRSTIRTSDVLGRYGGEEFAMILPDSPDAVAFAERLRATVSGAPVTADGNQIHITISVGVSHLQADDDLDSLLGRADAALYRSKSAGRDRVTVV